jgi:hypothetical protein
VELIPDVTYASITVRHDDGRLDGQPIDRR